MNKALMPKKWIFTTVQGDEFTVWAISLAGALANLLQQHYCTPECVRRVRTESP